MMKFYRQKSWRILAWLNFLSTTYVTSGDDANLGDEEKGLAAIEGGETDTRSSRLHSQSVEKLRRTLEIPSIYSKSRKCFRTHFQ